MKKEDFTYYSAQIRGWVCRAALVFSVLSFSGLNLQAHSHANTVVKTELAEMRIRKPVYSLNIQNGILVTSTSSAYSPFCIRLILNHYNVIRSKFKSYKNRLLLYPLIPKYKQVKISTSSSKDDSPFSLI